MRTAISVLILVALTGCVSKPPRLAVAKGRERYANPYGTILPTLPVPGPEGPRLNADLAIAPLAPATAFPVHPDLR